MRRAEMVGWAVVLVLAGVLIGTAVERKYPRGAAVVDLVDAQPPITCACRPSVRRGRP